jgi:hypothetical protein
VPRGRAILDGTGDAQNAAAVGNDSRLSNTLIGIQDYSFFVSPPYTSESQWAAHLAGVIGNFADRTAVTEWGAPMAPGSKNGVYYGTINSGQRQAHRLQHTQRQRRVSAITDGQAVDLLDKRPPRARLRDTEQPTHRQVNNNRAATNGGISDMPPVTAMTRPDRTPQLGHGSTTPSRVRALTRTVPLTTSTSSTSTVPSCGNTTPSSSSHSGDDGTPATKCHLFTKILPEPSF